MKGTKMAPRDASGLGDVCRLQADNHSVRSGWILFDGSRVSLVKQRSGEASTASVHFTAREFDALARWWFREQKLRTE
jgi:hypothetical protein